MSGVCFTGHRSIKEPLSNLYRRLDRAIEKAIYSHFFAESKKRASNIVADVLEGNNAG